MKTVYTFHATLEVATIKALRHSIRDYYLSKHPDATHIVRSPKSQIVYAVCGSESEAQEAKRKIEEVSVR